MDPGAFNSSSLVPGKVTDADHSQPATSEHGHSATEISSEVPPSDTASQTKNLKHPESNLPAENNSNIENSARAAFSRITSGFGMPFGQKVSSTNENGGTNNTASQSSMFESITKGLVDSSLGAVKAVQVKARHIVSQNKRRYQEGGFDLDMTYITENIIAMGFPAGDLSSGLFGFIEGLYRNHMEEVIKFFETHHKGKYKVYNLCSERLYDASLFEGKVASFPFDDHNCPPLQLVKLFCQSAYSWLKEDILNVVVVHCKAGKARTGLMICSLLLYLKFFPTSVECIEHYNQKRCVDSKGLTLPSQIRYVKYFERVLTQFNGETPPGRRCMLRGFRLHKCQYWVRPSITISDHNGVLFTTKKHPKTKDLMPEDFWIRSQRKGIVVFALPGEPGLTELCGDFKIYFHDRHGDFYCWLNTTMMENRVTLDASEFDDFDKRNLPTPGFDVEIVMIDYNGNIQSKSQTGDAKRPGVDSSDGKKNSGENKVSKSQNNDDDVFSDSEGEETTSASTTMGQTPSGVEVQPPINNVDEHSSSLTAQAGQLSLKNEKPSHGTPDTSAADESASIPNLGSGDIKAIAADASVFTFGDDEDYESE